MSRRRGWREAVYFKHPESLGLALLPLHAGQHLGVVLSGRRYVCVVRGHVRRYELRAAPSDASTGGLWKWAGQSEPRGITASAVDTSWYRRACMCAFPR